MTDLIVRNTIPPGKLISPSCIVYVTSCSYTTIYQREGSPLSRGFDVIARYIIVSSKPSDITRANEGEGAQKYSGEN